MAEDFALFFWLAFTFGLSIGVALALLCIIAFRKV